MEQYVHKCQYLFGMLPQGALYSIYKRHLSPKQHGEARRRTAGTLRVITLSIVIVD